MTSFDLKPVVGIREHSSDAEFGVSVTEAMIREGSHKEALVAAWTTKFDQAVELGSKAAPGSTEFESGIMSIALDVAKEARILGADSVLDHATLPVVSAVANLGPQILKEIARSRTS